MRQMRQKIPRYYDNQYNFWNKATSKKWESTVAKMVKIVCDNNKNVEGKCFSFQYGY